MLVAVAVRVEKVRNLKSSSAKYDQKKRGRVKENSLFVVVVVVVCDVAKRKATAVTVARLSKANGSKQGKVRQKRESKKKPLESLSLSVVTFAS